MGDDGGGCGTEFGGDDSGGWGVKRWHADDADLALIFADLKTTYI